MVLGFVSFRPHAYDCGRGGRRLGWDETEDEARARIVRHLTASTKHSFIQEDAQTAADAAELQEEEWEVPVLTPPPKGKGKGKQWREDVWPAQRSAPYPDQQIVVAVSPAASAAFTDVVGRAVHAIAKAEAGARASSRMARQAFQAFEDEANALAHALDSLKNIR